MNRIDRIVQVMKILREKYPRMDAKELMDLSYEIVMATTAPKTKVSNND